VNLGDITFSTETTVAVSGLLAALTGAIGLLFKLLIASKDRHIAATEAERDGYKVMADDAVNNLEKAVDRFVNDETLRVVKVVPVVPEHSSVPSPMSKVLADQATLRARITAAVLALGFPARK